MRRAKHMVLGMLLHAALVCAVGAQNYLAPDLINYQGTVVDADGSPVSDANYDVEFRLFGVETGGTALWGPQEFDGEAVVRHVPKIPVVKGRYNVILGPVDSAGDSLIEAIQSISAGGAIAFIEVTVEGTALGPRQQLLSAPFSIASSNGAAPGTIVMWFKNFVPPGWAFCNGSNGTPDLRSRPVMGSTAVGPAFYGLAGSAGHSHAGNVHSHSSSHTHNFAHTHTLLSHNHTVNPPLATTTTAGTSNQSLFGGGAIFFDLEKAHNHTVDIPNFFTAAGSSSTSSQTFTGTGSPSANSGGASVGSNDQFIDLFHFRLSFIMKL